MLRASVSQLAEQSLHIRRYARHAALPMRYSACKARNEVSLNQTNDGNDGRDALRPHGSRSVVSTTSRFKWTFCASAGQALLYRPSSGIPNVPVWPRHSRGVEAIAESRDIGAFISARANVERTDARADGCGAPASATPIVGSERGYKLPSPMPMPF